MAIAGLLSLATAAGNDALFEEPATTDRYQSVFADYQSQADLPLKSWRDANDEVAELAGHGGHTMSKEPATKDDSSSSSKPESTPPDTGGHPQH